MRPKDLYGKWLFLPIVFFHGLLSFSVPATAQVFQPFSDGVYFREGTEQKYKGLPKIAVSFRELNDSASLEKTRVKISEYKTFKSPPFKLPGMYFVNPSLQSEEIISRLKKSETTINALRYYADTAAWTYDSAANSFQLFTFVPLEKIFQPCYIGQSEVRNAEYMEFVQFVIDSLARHLLFENGPRPEKFGFWRNDSLFLKRKEEIPWKSDDNETREALEPLFLPQFESFFGRKQIDSRKLNWKYFLYADNKRPKMDVINVYPDTLSWVHDFNFSETEAQSNIYFWHPAFKDHPVVGISFKQARAFLVWKTQRLQEELNEKGIPFAVECDFPNAILREMLSGAKDRGRGLILLPARQYDDVHPASLPLFIKPDLAYDPEFYSGKNKAARKQKDSLVHGIFESYISYKHPRLSPELYKKNEQVRTLNRQLRMNFNSFDSYFVFPTTCLPDKIKAKKNSPSAAELNYVRLIARGKVSFLDGNVSEWQKERFYTNDSLYYEEGGGRKKILRKVEENHSVLFPYKGSYEPWLRFYLKALDKCDYEGIDRYKQEIAARLVEFRNDFRLVSGTNWYDMGDLLNGANKHTFISEDSTHCTIGFRYVVRFKPK